MNTPHPAFSDASLWSGGHATPVQDDFGYTAPPSGLPAWRYEFPYRTTSASPGFMEPATVQVPGFESTPSPDSLPASDQAGLTEK